MQKKFFSILFNFIAFYVIYIVIYPRIVFLVAERVINFLEKKRIRRKKKQARSKGIIFN